MWTRLQAVSDILSVSRPDGTSQRPMHVRRGRADVFVHGVLGVVSARDCESGISRNLLCPSAPAVQHHLLC